MTPNTPPTFIELAAELGALVDAKNKAYGDSHSKTGEFFRLLYPQGLLPHEYEDALTLVRMFDKFMRIATSPGALGEEPYQDLAGYALLGLKRARIGKAAGLTELTRLTEEAIGPKGRYP